MDEDSKALRTLKRFIVAWPLLMLPFVPEIGKVMGSLVLAMALRHGALQ